MLALANGLDVLLVEMLTPIVDKVQQNLWVAAGGELPRVDALNNIEKLVCVEVGLKKVFVVYYQDFIVIKKYLTQFCFGLSHVWYAIYQSLPIHSEEIREPQYLFQNSEKPLFA